MYNDQLVEAILKRISDPIWACFMGFSSTKQNQGWLNLVNGGGWEAWEEEGPRWLGPGAGTGTEVGRGVPPGSRGRWSSSCWGGNFGEGSSKLIITLVCLWKRPGCVVEDEQKWGFLEALNLPFKPHWHCESVFGNTICFSKISKLNINWKWWLLVSHVW